jgi:ribosome biogenesis GTPase
MAAQYDPWRARAEHEPARVAVEFNHLYRVYGPDGDLEAVVSGRLKHHATSRSELPAVGDWVVVRRRADEGRASIVHVLPRRSCFSRKAAGGVTDEQVVAANVDVVFLVMALDGDFSPRRLERYLLLARDSGAASVVLLTKPDLCADLPAAIAAVAAVSGPVPVHVLNPRTGDGVDAIRTYVTHGRTCALLGSSGVGKSTLVNRLLGREKQKTLEVRESDQRGRHTTTHRELIELPGGALLLDTPGLRELQLWSDGAGLDAVFEDVTTLAAACRFTDCGHGGEPGCAVRAAVAEERLDPARLASYQKLQAELRALEIREDPLKRRAERGRWKSIYKSLRHGKRT